MLKLWVSCENKLYVCLLLYVKPVNMTKITLLVYDVQKKNVTEVNQHQLMKKFLEMSVSPQWN